MSKVPLNKENMEKCVCPQCPVQTKSQCIKEKMEKAKEMMNKGEGNMMPDAENISGMYCATGVASCKDIDTSQMCICGNCPLWAEYDLPNGKPMGYYCRDGKAE